MKRIEKLAAAERLILWRDKGFTQEQAEWVHMGFLAGCAAMVAELRSEEAIQRGQTPKWGKADSVLWADWLERSEEK